MRENTGDLVRRVGRNVGGGRHRVDREGAGSRFPAVEPGAGRPFAGVEPGVGGGHRNARWALIDVGRRPPSVPAPPSVPVGVAAPAGAAGPAVSADPATLAAALAGLAAEHREALAATYFRRRTVNEAAALLGLPVETLKERVYAALQALQRAVS